MLFSFLLYPLSLKIPNYDPLFQQGACHIGNFAKGLDCIFYKLLIFQMNLVLGLKYKNSKIDFGGLVSWGKL